MKFTIPGLTTSALNANTNGAAADNAHMTAAPVVQVGDNEKYLAEKDVVEVQGDSSSDSHSDSDFDEKVDVDAQHGTQAVQAMTQVWSRNNLITAYVLMWIMEFVLAFSSGIINTLTPYVTSSFEEHSLTALTSVIAYLIAGLFKLPYAKIMDIWGRPQALTLMVGVITLGIVMMAGCNSVGTYCAAQVFFWTGMNGIDFSITVFIADTSKLKNRGLMLGYTSSPYLITTWVYGMAAQRILDTIGFRWGFGVFAIVVPVTCAPLVALFYINQRKAEKMGLIPARPRQGTIGQTVLHYAKEFDVIGLLILATGLSLFLLAFNLYSLQTDTWRSPMIISFIVIGGLLVLAFGVWEKYFAPITFVPWTLLKNRTVIFTYTMAFSLYMAWYIWDSYFYSLLIVLFDQSITHATYISNIYTMGSCFICIVYGLCLRHYGKLKVYSLAWGVPLTMLGVGLMIKFRQPDVNIGYIVMCQIFIAFGGGVLVISEQTTLMAVSKQRDFPALLAVEAMVISIGSAVGSTVAGAMWTGIFPQKLMANLPASAQADFASIYGSLTVQSSYPVGSAERDAINLSYGQTQRYMLIGATSLYVITLVSVALWQNVDVKNMKQRRFGLL